MSVLSINLKDGYKSGHFLQYPKLTNLIYINWTGRESRLEGVDHYVVFGIQYFIKEYLIKHFKQNFFDLPKAEAIRKYNRRMKNYLGNPDFPTYHMEHLHDLGYLPIEIKALAEGTRCPIRVPMMTVVNTLSEFYWIPNFLETLMSCTIWGAVNSATIAYEYRKLLDQYANETSDIPEFVAYQGHDFSFRGMFGLEASCISGMAHLTSFVGTDTIPAIDCLEEYYAANADEEVVGESISATEHAVCCLLSAKLAAKYDGDLAKGEFEHFRHLINNVYPTGAVSIVSDTWDFWAVLTDFLPRLKNEIMSRNGKTILRPDTGDPVKIVCGEKFASYNDLIEAQSQNEDLVWDEAVENCEGRHSNGGGDYIKTVKVLDKYYKLTYEVQTNRHDKTFYYPEYIKLKSSEEFNPSPEEKGAIEVLWEIFGGTINSKGYKQLDSHIGLIYGDSITMNRAKQICELLKNKGFASTNVALGIGSFSYQYNTRDTLGQAVKATYGEVENEPFNIFKKPKTGDGMKNSAKGLLMVMPEIVPDPNGGMFSTYGDLVLHQEVSKTTEQNGLLKTVFKDGVLTKEFTLKEIRNKLNYKAWNNG